MSNRLGFLDFGRDCPYAFPQMDIAAFLPKIGMIYIPMLLALCVHEWAHGFMAKLRGDRTAELAGRLTLNPAAHIDPIGTVVFPLISIALNSPLFFGWAKPVPFDPRNLKNPRVDSFWIALAGPLSNVVLALLGTVAIAIAIRVSPMPSDSGLAFMKLTVSFIQINLFLALFNLLPIHPLDGGKVIARFLPAQWNYKLEQHEQTIGLVLMFVLLMGGGAILGVPVLYAFDFLLTLAGVRG